MTAELEAKETAVAARTNGMPPFKDFLTFVPLLATALAIFYDVGYFYGFDLNYFSFFTLNEHIVFALQVLPYGMLVCALSLPHVLWVFNSKSYALGERQIDIAGCEQESDKQRFKGDPHDLIVSMKAPIF
jgi:hypothetical protein